MFPLDIVFHLSYNHHMIIFDSSTLILLARIDLLEIFIQSFHDTVLIPEKVRIEIYYEEREETPLLNKFIENKKIKVYKVRNSKLVKKLMEDFAIGAGEAEVLALAIQEKTNIIATDDRNAIRACKLLQLNFTTAIAILVRTFEKKLIDREEALIKLHKLEYIARYKLSIINNVKKHIKGGV